MILYTSKDGDILDAICFKYYGTTANQIVEKVLAANRQLADLDATFVAGTRIVLPDLIPGEKSESVKLWS